MKKLFFIITGALLVFGASHSQAQIISVQFDPYQEEYAVNQSAFGGEAASAGVDPATNWNVEWTINGTTSGGLPDANTTPSTSSLEDSLGTPTPVTVSYDLIGGGTYNYYSYIAPASPNQAIFTGELATNAYNGGDTTPSTVSLSGIDYASYDLIVYLQGGGSGANLSLSLDGGPALADILPNTTDQQGPVTFTQITASGGSGNYVEYTDLTGSSQVLSFTSTSGNSAGISGFQIVDAAAAPEPSTYVLMLAGLGILVVVSRRHRQV